MQQQGGRRPGEASFAVLLVVVSAAAFWQSYEISGFSGPTEPGVFPMLAAGVMLISAVAILRDVVARDRAPRQGLASALLSIAPPRLLLVIAMIAGYVGAIPWLGFMVSSGLFLFAAFWVLWRRGPLWSALLTVAALAAIYLIFREVFQVVLPRGVLWRDLF